MPAQAVACVGPEDHGRKYPSGRELTLIIVITIVSAVLAVNGMPVVTVLELVTGCGLVAVHLARRAPLAATPQA
ncbi:hypothetical protein [Streptomyces sp. TR06-5]|uniref:hypothetical protein n=1 Tax=Streptomyces sp. TR06-5 TaxID=3385976 RepID=UPI0039A160AC